MPTKKVASNVVRILVDKTTSHLRRLLMRLNRISKFTKPITNRLLLTQQAVISQIVCGILFSRSLLLAEIARGFETDVEFPHNLKRVSRFVNNERLSSTNSKQEVARRLIRQTWRRLHLPPHQRLEIIIDWTSIGDFQALVALIPVEGRAVPVLQWVVKKWEFKISQNDLENQFIQSLSRCIPVGLRVVIVADRGFQRTSFLIFLNRMGLGYVIRLKGDAWIETQGYSGKLKDYPLSLGQQFKLSRVIYHKTRRYHQKVVFNCERIKAKVATWMLGTNLGLSAGQIVKLYQRRFWCEESFRDQKQEFDLEGVRVKQASRLENLMMALSIVILMIAVIGMRGEKLGYSTKFSLEKKGVKVISWMQVGLKLLRESQKYLNLLFDNSAKCFSYHWA